MVKEGGYRGSLAPRDERSVKPMHVECPNCSTVYEVPTIHFVDGTRRLRCTECGYRWNQSADEVELSEGKKSTPLLDMLEPAMNMEASAAVRVDLLGDDDEADDGITVTEGLNPQAADAAYQEIDEALAPLPAPTPEEVIEDAGRRWQWGLGIVALTLMVSGLILGREAVVSAAPFTQQAYRGLGLEPWSALRAWDVCLADTDESEVRLNITNTSSFRRLLPDLYVTDAQGGLLQLAGPNASLRSGETARHAAPLNGAKLSQPAVLTLAARTDRTDGRAFGAC